MSKKITVNKLIINDCALNKSNLKKLMTNFSSRNLELLDLSGLHFNLDIKVEDLNYKIKNTSQYKLFIGYSCLNFDLVENLGNKINTVVLEWLNINEHKNKLFNLFKKISQISTLKVKKCQRESTVFYVLKEMLLSTEIQNLDLSYSVINSNNVDDVIEIVEKQAKVAECIYNANKQNDNYCKIVKDLYKDFQVINIVIIRLKQFVIVRINK